MVVNGFLPAIPFIHSGYELAERYPINTGLDFTVEQIRALPSDRLPLFSEYAYNWLSAEEFTPFVGRVLALRARYTEIVVDPSPASFRILEGDNPAVIAFARLSSDGSRKIAVAGNADFASPAAFHMRLDTAVRSVTDLIGGRSYDLNDGVLAATLEPGACCVFEY
jgi:hypothetical protein